MKTPYDLPETELLDNLAEKCMEMSQAALRLRRAIAKNPVIGLEEEWCTEGLIMSHADVCNAFKALKWDDKAMRLPIMEDAWKEWEKSLN